MSAKKEEGIILITHDMEIAKQANIIYLLEGDKLHEQTP